MRIIPLIIRYGTFALAAYGIYQMIGVLQIIHAQEPKIAPPPVTPPLKPYESAVAATGILEALSENVAVGVPAPGLVTKVHVKVSQRVKQGAPLFELDARELRAALISQQAAVKVAAADLEVSRAQLAKMQDMLSRMQSVPDQRAISQDDLKNRTNDVAVAKAQVLAAEAGLQSAEAAVKQTETLLERLTVRAPRDGSILQVNIREGEYASPSNKSAPMVLGDLEKLQVRADVDEQNASRVRPGQEAKAYIKGDTKNALALAFERIEPFVIPKMSLTGSSTERVDTRVLQVIFSLQIPKERPLYVGQQVDVFINAAAASDSKPKAN